MSHPADTQPHRVGFLVYDGFQAIDLAGPAGAFAAANALSNRALYDVAVLAGDGGRATSLEGIPVSAERLAGRTVDTLIATGLSLEALDSAERDPALLDALRAVSSGTVRTASVCLGAFVLGAAGLLIGRRTSTHWDAAALLAERHPDVRVDAEALYVVDGPIWTSAGATAGIDMALAMIEADHGTALMRRVAQRLVVYAHRPGNQSQFSGVLHLQAVLRASFAPLATWVEANVHRPIKVAEMAAEVGMSERSFHRRFRKAVGVTPARYVETMRLERSKRALEAGLSVKEAATASGYRTSQGLHAAFEPAFGMAPDLYRRMHAGGARKGMVTSLSG